MSPIEIYVFLAFKGRILAKRFAQIKLYTPMRVGHQLAKDVITTGLLTSELE